MRTLSSLPLKELLKLRERIAREIDSRGSRESLRAKFEMLAAQQGFQLDEVLALRATDGKAPKSAPRKSGAGKAPIKYRHPSNRDLAWSGRGSRPAWVKAWIANGGSLDALANTAARMQSLPPAEAVPVSSAQDLAA